jgi:hypothetical protein
LRLKRGLSRFWAFAFRAGFVRAPMPFWRVVVEAKLDRRVRAWSRRYDGAVTAVFVWARTIEEAEGLASAGAGRGGHGGIDGRRGEVPAGGRAQADSPWPWRARTSDLSPTSRMNRRPGRPGATRRLDRRGQAPESSIMSGRSRRPAHSPRRDWRQVQSKAAKAAQAQKAGASIAARSSKAGTAPSAANTPIRTASSPM